MNPFSATGKLVLACIAVALIAWSGLAGAIAAQSAPARLLDREPYDQLTLDEANDNAVIKVTPIPFPGRRIPEKPKPSDKLTVKLVDTGRDYEVAWKHIARIDLFEDLLVQELRKLTAEGNFNEAYDYLVQLRNDYPQAKGLDEAHHAYLYQSAGAAFKQAKYAEALGLVEELHRLSPQYRGSTDGPTLIQVLSNAADKLIADYVGRGDYRSARVLLKRLTTSYSVAKEPFAVKWRDVLVQAAGEQRDAAREALAKEEYIAAYDAHARMMEIWPQVEGGADLAAEMAEKHPRVRVGVLSPALQHDARSIANAAARRTARLLERPLFEYQGMGPEGGLYQCPYGETQLSDDGRQLTFRLRPVAADSAQTGLNGYRLTQFLLPSGSTPATSDDVAIRRLVQSVEVKDVWQVAVNFRHAHVLPQAILQSALDSEEDSIADQARFTPLAASEGVTRYVANRITARAAAPGQIAEIVEQVYEDPQRAVIALEQGEIEVLDNVFPGDVSKLKQNRSIAVQMFGIPTTHFIAVRHHNPLLANRTFRRALLYGSDRETILRQTLLRGASLPGSRVISAPFPAPASTGDVVAYGYDQTVSPRPYDVRLALTLRILGQREVKALYDRRGAKPPPSQKLTLAHPADEVARIGCRALAAQWKTIGVEVALVELSPGVFVDPEGKHDLLYVSGCMAEPLVDAGRLLGAGGLAPSESSFIQLCLRQIDSSANWQQARQHFQQLHRLLHEDVTVIPLWQMYDHFAYHRTLQGVGSQPVSLYENVSQWRISPRAMGK